MKFRFGSSLSSFCLSFPSSEILSAPGAQLFTILPLICVYWLYVYVYFMYECVYVYIMFKMILLLKFFFKFCLSLLLSVCVCCMPVSVEARGIQCGVEFFQRERTVQCSQSLFTSFKASKRVAASRHPLFLLPTSESHLNCLHLAQARDMVEVGGLLSEAGDVCRRIVTSFSETLRTIQALF